MTTSLSPTPSFPGLTGESRKALDARFRPAGMTSKQEGSFKACPFNNETLNKREKIVFYLPRGIAWASILEI